MEMRFSLGKIVEMEKELWREGKSCDVDCKGFLMSHTHMDISTVGSLSIQNLQRPMTNNNSFIINNSNNDYYNVIVLGLACLYFRGSRGSS